MLSFELHNTVRNEQHYQYLEEGKGEPGLVILDTDTGEARIDKLAPGDEFKQYAFHLLWYLEDAYKNDKLQDTGAIMWY